MRVRSHSAPPVIQRNPEEGEEGEFHLPSEELETTEPQGFKVFEEGEHFLDPKEAETTEAPGFTLLDEQGNPKKSARSHHYEPQARRELQEKEKPKKTISDKLRRYRNMAKHFVKGHTVHSYGKKGLHAIMTRDEKQIRRAARLI